MNALRPMAAFVPREAESLSGLSLDLAHTEQERRAGLDLLHAVYVRKGFLPADAPPPAAQPWVPGSAMFLARRHGEIAGTITVYHDCPAGLPIDAVHRADIAAARARSSPLAEVGSLATHEDQRGDGVAALLFLAAFRWAVVTDARCIVACVHPSYRRLYGKWLGFETLGECRPHPRFSGSPSIPIGLDLSILEPRLDGRAAARPEPLDNLIRLVGSASAFVGAGPAAG